MLDYQKNRKVNIKDLYEKVHRACNNGKNINDRKIYASMASMSDNNKFSSRNFGENLQLTNFILD